MKGIEGSIRGQPPLEVIRRKMDGAKRPPRDVSESVVSTSSQQQQTGPFGSADISRRSTDQPDISHPSSPTPNPS